VSLAAVGVAVGVRRGAVRLPRSWRASRAGAAAANGRATSASGRATPAPAMAASSITSDAK